MNRRKFFSFLPALAALPAICKSLIVRPTRYWAGTIIPRSTPWEELNESQKRVVENSGKNEIGYQYSYSFVRRDGKVVATSPDLKTWRTYGK